jgi:hypothetical protein
VQVLIRSDKDFLSYVLRVMEIPELRICQRVYAGLILVHQQAKCPCVTVEALIDYIPVFGAHFFTPVLKAFTYYDPAEGQIVNAK